MIFIGEYPAEGITVSQDDQVTVIEIGERTRDDGRVIEPFLIELGPAALAHFRYLLGRAFHESVVPGLLTTTEKDPRA